MMLRFQRLEVEHYMCFFFRVQKLGYPVRPCEILYCSNMAVNLICYSKLFEYSYSVGI